jgi:hypothetical protein
MLRFLADFAETLGNGGEEIVFHFRSYFVIGGRRRKFLFWPVDSSFGL